MTKAPIFERYLSSAIVELALKRGKMAFISGPRQVGKTTEAEMLRQGFDQSVYKNWDQDEFKRQWAKSPSQVAESFSLEKHAESKLLILDEIHKASQWKSKLKGLYDIHKDEFNIVVTGSARLNIFQKGGDSLMGRYCLFRLHPFSLPELLKIKPPSPEQTFANLFRSKPLKVKKDSFALIEQLYTFGGFPEPLLAKKKNILNLWRKGRKDKIVHEDLRDLSQIMEVGKIETLLALLPEKVGSPLSVQSLREDLNASHDSVTRWLVLLKELFYHFEIKPYATSIPRSLKKEGKIYFYEWTENLEKGAKFENMIASALLKACHYWEDTGEGTFELNYLRNKEKEEVDFIVIRDRKPWFMVECKAGSATLDPSYKKFQKHTGCNYIQVVYDRQVFRKVDSSAWIMGADYFLSQLV